MYKAESISSDVPVVAVIGGGASGGLTAIHVLWEAILRALPVSVAIIDQQGVDAAGQARTVPDAAERHAPDDISALSAFTDDPGHLVRWAADRQVGGDGFLPPAIYGDYLRDVLAGLQRRAAAQARVTCVDSQVVGIRRGCGRRDLRLDLAAEGRIDADLVILASGGPATGLGGSRAGLGAAWPAGAAETRAGSRSDPLLRSLLGGGLARPGKLGRGIDAIAYGAVVDSAGNVSASLFAVGPLVGADGIAAIRDQTEALARHLVSRLAIAGPRSAA